MASPEPDRYPEMANTTVNIELFSSVGFCFSLLYDIRIPYLRIKHLSLYTARLSKPKFVFNFSLTAVFVTPNNCDLSESSIYANVTDFFCAISIVPRKNKKAEVTCSLTVRKLNRNVSEITNRGYRRRTR